MQKKKAMAGNYNLCAIQYQALWIFVTIYVHVHSIVVHETDVELEAAFSL
jgi:hypothetical protein